MLLVLALWGLSVHELLAQDTVNQRFLEFNQPSEPQFVSGQVIVKMKTDISIGVTTLDSLGLESVDRRTSGGEFIYRIPTEISAAFEPEQARDSTVAVARRLNARPDVEYAQPNYLVYPVGISKPLGLAVAPTDPRYAEQWHYFNNGTGTGESPGGINLARAWDTSTGDSSIVVSVLDTGILLGHPDISGSNPVAGFDMITLPFRANDGDGRDTDPTDPGDAVVANECGPGRPARGNSWHGTHVAGTVGVGGTDNGIGVAGVNWEVSLQSVRVLGKCGGTEEDINDAIRWAAGLPVPGVPANATPARVISMSLGAAGLPCSSTPATQAAIDDAVAAGTTVVVAAGNDAMDAAQVFPASCNNVITVAASDARGHLVTRYSNFGATIEIMAPGGDVLRDDNGDGNPDGVLSMLQGGYDWYNGTSMATPHVSGVAALWLAVEPTLTPTQLLTALQASALPRTSTQCPSPCGAGLLNAFGGPIPSGGLTLTLALDPNKKLRNGESSTARVTVTSSGVPLAGALVNLSSGDPNVATVSPSATTNAAGEATAVVTGVSRGETMITASVSGATDSKPVKVPDLSKLGFVLLAFLVILIALAHRHRRPLGG
jgi:serine protease